MDTSFTLGEIEKIAQDLFKDISKKINKTSVIVTLSGELGAGKTILTKEIGKILGIKERIVSPTFVIMKKYKTAHQQFKFLVHIDAYRLKNSQELLNLGWEELIKNKENLIIIEWPEIVQTCLGGDVYKVKLEHKNKQTRIIKTLL